MTITPSTPTNGGVLYSYSTRTALEPQLARILAAHEHLYGWVPAAIYLRGAALTSYPYGGRVIPVIATGRGWPGADNLALSDTVPSEVAA